MKIRYLIYVLFSAIMFIPLSKTGYEISNFDDTVASSGYVEDSKTEELYYGKTKEELIEQINKSLNSTLTSKGDVIVNYSIEYGVDPYLITAIILHETGCKWNCSYLVKACNNVAGQKGSPSCNGGSYKKYDTLDDGIKGAIYNVAVNYIQKGLTTPEEINTKYAENKTWYIKINNYINEIKSK